MSGDWNSETMEQRKLIRSTKTQIHFLINYMASHKTFANASNSGPSAMNAAEEWKHLRELLKQHGPDKSVEQWKTTWRDLKRKARKQNEDASATMSKEVIDQIPVVSDSTIKVLDTIGQEIVPECKRDVPAELPIKQETKFVRRRRFRLPPAPVTERDLFQAQTQRNVLLQKLCDLVAEQNSILKERNQIERRKMYSRNRNRR